MCLHFCYFFVHNQAQIEDLREELCYYEEENENVLSVKVRLTVAASELEQKINELNCLIGAKSESLASVHETLKVSWFYLINISYGLALFMQKEQ